MKLTERVMLGAFILQMILAAMIVSYHNKRDHDRIETKLKEAEMKSSVLLLEIRGVSLQIDKLRQVPEWSPNLQPLPNLTLPWITVTNWSYLTNENAGPFITDTTNAVVLNTNTLWEILSSTNDGSTTIGP